MSSKIHRISKGEKRKAYCGKNYSINTTLNTKTRFVQHKKKNAIISEVSWCNVFRKTGSDL